MAKLKMDLQALGWVMDPSGATLGRLSNVHTNEDHSQPHTENDLERSLGTPITIEAFLMMLARFWVSMSGRNPPVKDVYAFTISKSALLQIIAQEDCEKLRFFFVLPDEDDKLSMAVAGLNKENKLVQLATLLRGLQELENQRPAFSRPISPIPYEENAVIYEKVGRNTLGGITSLRDVLQNELRITENKDYTFRHFVEDLGNIEKHVAPKPPGAAGKKPGPGKY